ncbi:MAG: hypothetical protein WD055_00905 [Candidatus Dependentiae bacterium]
MKLFYLCTLAVCLNIQSAENSKESTTFSRFDALRRGQVEIVRKTFNKDNIHETDPKTREFPIVIAASYLNTSRKITHTIIHPDGLPWDCWEEFIPYNRINALAYLISLNPTKEECDLAAKKLKKIVDNLPTASDYGSELFPADLIDKYSFNDAKRLHKELIKLAS